MKPSARIWAKIRAFVRRPEIVQIVFWCGFEACRTRTILLYSWNRRRTTDATFMQRTHDSSQWKGDSCERMDSQQYKNRSSLEHKSLLSRWTIRCRSSSSIYFKTIPFRGSESWMALTGTWQNQCRPRKKRTQLRGNPLLKQDQGRSVR